MLLFSCFIFFSMIEIYTTPQCGFCKQLKALLIGKNIPFTAYDVTTDAKALDDMQRLSNGNMSVPVTVINQGKPDQVVAIGYNEAVKALKLEEGTAPSGRQQQAGKATLTCPECGHKQQGDIPTTSCVPFYVCDGCKKTIRASGDDCCVFCSYADRTCPLKK